MRTRVSRCIYLITFLGSFLLFVYIVPFSLSVATDDTDLHDDGGYSTMQRGLFTPKIPSSHGIIPITAVDVVIPFFIATFFWIRLLLPELLLADSTARSPPARLALSLI